MDDRNEAQVPRLKTLAHRVAGIVGLFGGAALLVGCLVSPGMDDRPQMIALAFGILLAAGVVTKIAW